MPIYRIWDHKTVDNKYLLWVTMNPSSGVYDWTQMDAVVSALEARGIRGWFTLCGTPAWARVGTAYADPYGNPSGASAADPAAVTAFVTTLMTRYNGNGRQFFRFIEPWNEPEFDGTSSGFYKGTAPQMAAMVRACYLAAKAVDPDVTVTSPSDWSAVGHIDELFAASDGAGGTGADWVDAICLHPYYRWWDEDPYLETGQGTSVGVFMRAVRSNLASLGMSNKPVIWGETGYVSSASSAEHLAAAGSPDPAEVYARWAFRQALGVATEGVRAMLLYDYDGPLVLSGNPVTAARISAAWSAINEICGETLTSISRFGDEYRITTQGGRLIRFTP